MVPKINIFMKLISEDEKINKKLCGIINDNRIVYIDGDIKTTIILDDKLSLVRENKDYKFSFVYNNKKMSKGSYILNTYNYSIPLDIYTNELIIENNYVKIDYHLWIDQVDCGNFLFELKYENM